MIIFAAHSHKTNRTLWKLHMGNQCRIGFGAALSILLNWFYAEISEYQLLGNEMCYEVITLLSHYLQVSLTIETNNLVYFCQLRSNFNTVLFYVSTLFAAPSIKHTLLTRSVTVATKQVHTAMSICDRPWMR